MALTTSMSRLAKHLSEAIRSFAASEGWAPDEYAVIATFDRRTDFVYLTVGSVRPVDRFRWHAGIKQKLRETFGSQSSAATQNVLVIRNLERLDQIYDYLILDEDDLDMTDLL